MHACAERAGKGEVSHVSPVPSSRCCLPQLFQPLGFLGTIYGAIVDAIEDMRSLTELLGNVRRLGARAAVAPPATAPRRVLTCAWCVVTFRSPTSRTSRTPPACTLKYAVRRVAPAQRVVCSALRVQAH